jgi:hypothetical protein
VIIPVCLRCPLIALHCSSATATSKATLTRPTSVPPGEPSPAGGPLTNGAISLILSEDGDFIRDIILGTHFPGIRHGPPLSQPILTTVEYWFGWVAVLAGMWWVTWRVAILTMASVIIAEEISRGLDSAIRIQLDESVRVAKSTVLTVLGVAGREKDVLSGVFRDYPGASP